MLSLQCSNLSVGVFIVDMTSICHIILSIIRFEQTQPIDAVHRNLRTLVKCITLRRTKTTEVNGRPLVSLPEKTVCVEQVELSQSEREEYELARNEGRNIIGRYASVSACTRLCSNKST